MLCEIVEFNGVIIMINSEQKLNCTQAAGAQIVELGSMDSCRLHQIQVYVTSVAYPENAIMPASGTFGVVAATAGTLAIALKSPGGINFETLQDTIDLTNPEIVTIQGMFSALRFTPTGFDAAKYFHIFITSGDDE
jgi:hypothetical protein